MAVNTLNSSSSKNNLELTGLAKVYQEETGPSRSLARLLSALILYKPLSDILI